MGAINMEMKPHPGKGEWCGEYVCSSLISLTGTAHDNILWR